MSDFGFSRKDSILQQILMYTEKSNLSSQLVDVSFDLDSEGASMVNYLVITELLERSLSILDDAHFKIFINSLEKPITMLQLSGDNIPDCVIEEMTKAFNVTFHDQIKNKVMSDVITHAMECDELKNQ